MVANVGRLTQMEGSGGVSRLESEHDAWTAKCTFGSGQQILGGVFCSPQIHQDDIR